MNSLALRMSDMVANLRGAYVLSRLRPMIMHIAQKASAQFDASESEPWVMLKRNRAQGDREVLWLGSANQKTVLICHIPRSKSAVLRYQHHRDICASLWNTRVLGVWREVLPRVLYQGLYENHLYWLEAPLPGVSASRVIQQSKRRDIVLRAAVETILCLHQRTSRVVTFDEILFKKWVLDPLRAIRESTLPLYYFRSHAILSEIEQRLARRLLGKPVTVCWIHGDYWPENILVTPDGARVTGIVDWELSHPDGLPLIDLINLLLSTYRVLEAKELGHLIIELLEQGELPPEWKTIYDEVCQRLGNNLPAIQDVLILFWIQHTSTKVFAANRLFINPFWARANYVSVLRHLNKLWGG